MCHALGPKKPGESGKTANGPKIKKAEQVPANAFVISQSRSLSTLQDTEQLLELDFVVSHRV